jgi:hypothetical protein
MKKHANQKLQLRKLTIATLTARNLRGGDFVANTHTCDAACDVKPSYGASCVDVCYASIALAADGVCNLSDKCLISGPVTACTCNNGSFSILPVGIMCCE